MLLWLGNKDTSVFEIVHVWRDSDSGSESRAGKSRELVFLLYRNVTKAVPPGKQERQGKS